MDFLAALGLVFVIEGVVVAAFPHAARAAMLNAAQSPERLLRIFGIAAAFAGVLIVWLVRG